MLPSSAENSVKEKEPFLRHCSRRQYAEIEPLIVLRFVRLCRKARSLTGFGYPFDLPWVQYAEELYRQAADVQACLDVLQQLRITPVFLKNRDCPLPLAARRHSQKQTGFLCSSVPDPRKTVC